MDSLRLQTFLLSQGESRPKPQPPAIDRLCRALDQLLTHSGLILTLCDEFSGQLQFQLNHILDQACELSHLAMAQPGIRIKSIFAHH